jgi:hypothetical protein
LILKKLRGDMKSDIAKPDPIRSFHLPDPDVLVEDIIENLESSLESLREISNNLSKE